MDILFFTKLAISFLVGGIWVTITTILAERYGSKIGGWIGGLPSTSLLALFFIGLTQSPAIASEATTVIPAAMGGFVLFILIYIWLVKSKKLFFSLATALVGWFLVLVLIIYFDLENYVLSLLIFLVLFLTSFLIIEKVFKIKSAPMIKVKHTTGQIIGRALFGGFIIGFAVLMAKISGPVFGGIFAAFPAMFISVMIITYHDHGAEFSRAMAKPFMISASINVLIYTIAARYAYQYIDNLYLGTLLAILISLIGVYFTYMFIKKFIK